MSETVLITGGSGMIGQAITQALLKESYQIIILSRQAKKLTNLPNSVKWAYWHPDKNEIDISALKQAHHIIHLAGDSLADGRWTAAKKERILKSRTQSSQLLYQKINEHKISLRSFISASAIGFYGNHRKIQNASSLSQLKGFKESDPVGSDFIANVCQNWEQASSAIQDLGIRTVIIRIGLVLSDNGGLLAKIAPLAKKSLNVNMGSGKQIYPWIHIEDLARLFVYALQNETMKGIYNATSSVENQVNQKEFNELLAKHLHKKLFLPSIPPFLLKIILGDMSQMLLEGSYISNEKIIKQGFQFLYPELPDAFNHLNLK